MVSYIKCSIFSVSRLTSKFCTGDDMEEEEDDDDAMEN